MLIISGMIYVIKSLDLMLDKQVYQEDNFFSVIDFNDNSHAW